MLLTAGSRYLSCQRNGEEKQSAGIKLQRQCGQIRTQEGAVE
jgi:hypothetical protein